MSMAFFPHSKPSPFSKRQDCEGCADALPFVLLCFSMFFLVALQTVENRWFRDMVGALNPKAQMPDRRSLLSTMKNIKAGVLKGIRDILQGEHVCITTDGWTSVSNDTYMSLTVSFINKA